MLRMREECESPAGQIFNNMSFIPCPTTLNADEPVAMTTGQPRRPGGYLRQWGVVSVFGGYVGLKHPIFLFIYLFV